MTKLREIGSGLYFPEGPVAMPDGSVILTEIGGRKVSRVYPDGKVSTVAEVGGGPNGAAIGPDGALYVCNNGGQNFSIVQGITFPGDQSEDYAGGSIQRVDLATGKFETLYTHCGDLRLKSPNDLVFDRHGGFYFSDHGKMRHRDRDRGAVYYAKADGSSIAEVAFPMDGPNGVGLSPDGKTLYVAETWSRQFWAFAIEGPGKLGRDPKALFAHGGKFMAGAPGFRFFDSLAIDAEGFICIASPGEGVISVYAPDGKLAEVVETGDPLLTNICFGGPGLKTAYLTLAGTGRLVAMDWPRPGLPLAYLND
ncbi:MAG TPA: SMP-30/gluconolactonase/LRE family protein [Rubrivivax sp.]|nr:SMP-30/gluconolactonase/LRE family protein [Rubrivivax sp.]